MRKKLRKILKDIKKDQRLESLIKKGFNIPSKIEIKFLYKLFSDELVNLEHVTFDKIVRKILYKIKDDYNSITNDNSLNAFSDNNFNKKINCFNDKNEIEFNNQNYFNTNNRTNQSQSFNFCNINNSEQKLRLLGKEGLNFTNDNTPKTEALHLTEEDQNCFELDLKQEDRTITDYSEVSNERIISESFNLEKFQQPKNSALSSSFKFDTSLDKCVD